nr:MAG TPA: hypothetical protein [Caudoviricetes sp.]
MSTLCYASFLRLTFCFCYFQSQHIVAIMVLC